MTLGGREGSRTGWNGTHRMDLYEIGSHDRTCLYDRGPKAMAVRGNVRPVRGRCRFAVACGNHLRAGYGTRAGSEWPN